MTYQEQPPRKIGTFLSQSGAREVAPIIASRRAAPIRMQTASRRNDNYLSSRHTAAPRVDPPGVARGHIARHDTRAAPFGEGSIDRPPRTPPTTQLHRAPRHTCCAIRRSIDRSAASNKHHPPHNCLLSHRHRASGGPSPTSSLPRGHLLEPGRARGRGARRAPLAARRAARPHRPGAQRDVWRIRKGVGLVPPTTTTRRSHPATRRVASRRVAATASSSGSSAPT